MQNFCNYLRGNQDQTQTQIKLSKKALSFRKFLKHLNLILKHLFPKLLCASSFLLICLLIDVIALEVRLIKLK